MLVTLAFNMAILMTTLTSLMLICWIYDSAGSRVATDGPPSATEFPCRTRGKTFHFRPSMPKLSHARLRLIQGELDHLRGHNGLRHQSRLGRGIRR
jgi:hypothetical protein